MLSVLAIFVYGFTFANAANVRQMFDVTPAMLKQHRRRFDPWPGGQPALASGIILVQNEGESCKARGFTNRTTSMAQSNYGGEDNDNGNILHSEETEATMHSLV